MRGAGGSRTRFRGFADRRPAVRPRRLACFGPPTEGHVLARNRTWSPTFAGSCANPAHSEDLRFNVPTIPRPGIEPGLAASKAAVRPSHPRGNSRVPSPGVEPGLRPSESRVPSVTRRGRSRSRRPESNRHEPAYKAGASPFGHVGGEQGRKDLNPVREFWRLAALPGAHPCLSMERGYSAGVEPAASRVSGWRSDRLS